MPRRVDHEARRRELTGVVLTLAAERGLDAVSIREVAAASGVSIGTVQHYFATKDDLLLAAMQQVGDRFEARVRRAVEAEPTPRARLTRLLREFVPGDEQSRAELRMWLAFIARAAVVPALAELDVRNQALRRDACRHLVAEARAAGEAAGAPDPDRAADILNALVDGLAVQMATDPDGFPTSRAARALDETLDALLPPHLTDHTFV